MLCLKVAQFLEYRKIIWYYLWKEFVKQEKIDEAMTIVHELFGGNVPK